MCIRDRSGTQFRDRHVQQPGIRRKPFRPRKDPQCAGAVSYTHLDVYKRQHHWLATGGVIQTVVAPSSRTVSYTHLDVYKRQVLDRIVPGYYQRLDGSGVVERSTCCANTATEHLMMGKLMSDSIELWATQYKIDSFRFDLMGHQPRAVMEALGRRVDAATGRRVNLIGEGWNFGEVADGSRFVQASQLSLNGSGIGTFSDRARDALRLSLIHI